MKMLPDSSGKLKYYQVAKKENVVVGIRPRVRITTNKTILGLTVHTMYDPETPGVDVEGCNMTGENAALKFKRITYYGIRPKYAAAFLSLEVNRGVYQLDEISSNLQTYLTQLYSSLETECAMELEADGLKGVEDNILSVIKHYQAMLPPPDKSEVKVELTTTAQTAAKHKKAMGFEPVGETDKGTDSDLSNSPESPPEE